MLSYSKLKEQLEKEENKLHDSQYITFHHDLLVSTIENAIRFESAPYIKNSFDANMILLWIYRSINKIKNKKPNE